jgi:hypothetical protein
MRMGLTRGTVWVLMAGTIAARAFANPPAAPPEPGKPLPQVTVEADRVTLEHRVFNFVTDITRSAPRGESLHIWRAPICPLVAGLPKDQGEFVLARLSQAAQAAGAPLDGEKCRPNLYVVFTQEPDELIKTWREHSNRSFGGVRGTPAAVDRFATRREPVRVWYNREFGSADGGPLTSDSSMEGFALNGSAAVVNKRAKDTRLTFNEVMLFSSVIVVVDGNQVTGLQFGQLADFIAMASMTELDLDAPLGTAPTILQLFTARAAGATPPSGLTTWDSAFLKALYYTPLKSVMQRSTITTEMMHSLAP